MFSKMTGDKLPKRSLTPYIFFVKDNMTKIKRDNPKMDNCDMISKISKEWNTLKPADKNPYVRRAEADKTRYMREKHKFKNN